MFEWSLNGNYEKLLYMFCLIMFCSELTDSFVGFVMVRGPVSVHPDSVRGMRMGMDDFR